MPTTSSSTSSSEAGRRWRGVAVTFCVAALALTAGVLAALAALDPFDTGRMSLVQKKGVSITWPGTANASRGRDPDFNAAIIGNSRIQMVEPTRLDAITGLRFVSLMVPAMWPDEEMTILRWFLRNHERPRAVVIGLDDWWCMPTTRSDKPFPSWLYAENPIAYLKGLFRFETLEQASRRLAYLGGESGRVRPDGFWDYENDYLAIGALEPELHHRRLTAPPPTVSDNPANRFPAMDLLQETLRRAPADTRVVLAWGPVYRNHVPVAGSAADATWRACRESLLAVAAKRPSTAVVDWSTGRPESAVEDHFFDQTHYRRPLAERYADAIAQALQGMGQARP